MRLELDNEVHVYSKKVQGLVSLLKADKDGLETLYQAVTKKLVRQIEAVSNSTQRMKMRHHALAHSVPGATLPGDLGRPPSAAPSPFLVEALQHFMEVIAQTERVVSELEQLYFKDAHRARHESSENLSKILENFTVYFNHVVAQYSSAHDKMDALKKTFLATQKQHGIERDHFAEADRRVAAAEDRLKKEAELKRQAFLNPGASQAAALLL